MPVNSDYGIGCVYSPIGLMIFVAVEGTFVCFTEGHDHFISNNIALSCYYVIPKLVGTATTKTATRANRKRRMSTR